jgi:ATP-dependent DNA helicase DinG
VPPGPASQTTTGSAGASARPGKLPGAGELLAAAVAGIGGAERPGQVAMAEAVERSFAAGEHLAVQAGTGTGKSLAYLVPAARYAITEQATVVVSTATIALQRQLIDRDLPRLAAALGPLLGREPVFAILKGRRNYLCRQRLSGGAPEEPGEVLFDPRSVSATGRQVERLHEWAATTKTGDRDEIVPGVSEVAWRQVSVSARECTGAQRCPFGQECFAEQARAEAGQADIVVTNHALLAIDAMEDFPALPEHDVVIIDEAHDLVDRVTSVSTDELSAPGIEIAARRCGRMIEESVVAPLRESGSAVARMLDGAPAGRIDLLDDGLAATLAAVRDAARNCQADLKATAKGSVEDPDRLARSRAALAQLGDVYDAADRMLAAFGPPLVDRTHVVWLDQPLSPESNRPPTLRVAPLSVGGLLARRLFGQRTVALTSATLSLGGSFEPLARQWGLPAPGAGPGGPDGLVRGEADAAAGPGADSEEPGQERDEREAEDDPGRDGAAGRAGPPGPPGRPGAPGRDAAPHSLAWTGLDVGSPFDHPRHGILYVARHLPPPGRDGLAEAYLTEMTELIEAAGGRTLGLFSSMRAAQQATDELRGRLSVPLLCQGEDSTAQLITQFAASEPTCLFGTLSLWQGVDVPGPALQLVMIDRIPFPRPDDPLASARQRAVGARGGNGFMAVAASHAALLLAQGTGRLLRTMTDRGVVAILDPRLATARYGGFLRGSLPPFWATTDPEVARGALRRLAAAATTSAEASAAAEPLA